MFDLGTSFRANVESNPHALAIVDRAIRLTYTEWYRRISSLVASFDELRLGPGDHLLTVLQNRWEAATLHWACQFSRVVITPVNWRAKADEIDFFIENSEAKAIVYEDISLEAVSGSKAARSLARIALELAARRRSCLPIADRARGTRR